MDMTYGFFGKGEYHIPIQSIPAPVYVDILGSPEIRDIFSIVQKIRGYAQGMIQGFEVSFSQVNFFTEGKIKIREKYFTTGEDQDFF
jgi:hypothetical protein